MPTNPSIVILSEVEGPAVSQTRAVLFPLARLVLLFAFFLSFRSEAQEPAVALHQPPTVRIAVLTLFHPKTLTITTALKTITLTYPESLTLPAQTITLEVPGKLTRTYRGALTITPHNGALLPVLTMDTETAVASIVAAEVPPNAPFEALKAQAIASRSYLSATPAGPLYDATDTTHDQFLRSPPTPHQPRRPSRRRHPPRRTHLATRHHARPRASDVFPKLRRAHPPSPRRQPGRLPLLRCRLRLLPSATPSAGHAPSPAPQPPSQAASTTNRTHGWSAIPSNSHTQTATTIEGTGTGHGTGLCQLGARRPRRPRPDRRPNPRALLPQYHPPHLAVRT